jgi:hypothetical protein
VGIWAAKPQKNWACKTQEKNSPEGEALSVRQNENPPGLQNIFFPCLFVMDRSQQVIIMLPLSHQLTKVYTFGSFLINQSPHSSHYLVVSFNSLSCTVIYGAPSSKGKHHSCSESKESLLWILKGPAQTRDTSLDLTFLS